MMVMVGDSEDQQALEFAFSTGRIHTYEHFYSQEIKKSSSLEVTFRLDKIDMLLIHH